MLCPGAEIALSAIATSVSSYLISLRIVVVVGAFVLMNGCSRAASTSWPEAPPDYVNVTTPDPAGTTATVALNVYDGTGEGIPLTARYLEGMDASATASSEGAAVCFTFAARSNALD